MTLAHAHGVLLGLVNIALGATLKAMPTIDPRSCRIGSPLLLAGCIMLPLGFLLGGLVTYGGDPGFGIFLVAPSATIVAVAVLLITIAVFRRP